MVKIATKFIVNGYYIPVTMVKDNKHIFFQFPYNKALIEEIKSMEGAKWHGYENPPVKMWSVDNSPRNQFAIAYLEGRNPYVRYLKPLPILEFTRPLYNHQKQQVAHFVARRSSIGACDMGTGKSLSAIEAMERLGIQSHEALYVGPKSGVEAFRRELKKWNSRVMPQLITYEGLVKLVTRWTDGNKAPKCVIFDECHKTKTSTSKRSQAAKQLADGVRADWGPEGVIIMLSGTPSPKSPTDWWNPVEVACPGFLKEGNIIKFRVRLSILEERQSLTGGVYPHHVSWKDDASKCSICGEQEGHEKHKIGNPKYHDFKASINEVAKLYSRLKGLVLVQFKKDCLDLPEKVYEELQLPLTPELLRTAKLIKETSPRVIEALTRLRELSDGFAYQNVEVGEEMCPNCDGTGSVKVPEMPEEGVDTQAPVALSYGEVKLVEVDCPNCNGRGKSKKYNRIAVQVPTPKDEALIDRLDDHVEDGRLVIWAGFTGSIDKIVELLKNNGWASLRIDGRGFAAQDANGKTISKEDALDAMDLSSPRFKELEDKYPKLAVISQPESGGLALTFTASSEAIFYSNSFKADARAQAEDRIHRIGMDLNRACKITDFLLLPIDRFVINNLKKKRSLELMTLGDLDKAMELVGEIR